MNVDQAVDRLTAQWPNAKTNSTMLDSYQRVLGGVPEEMLERLVNRLIEDHDFLPSVFMVRQTWNSMKPPLIVEPEPEPVKVPMPEWAKGCFECTHGIVQAPALVRDVPLYQERIRQMLNGDIHFCKCKAGQAYRRLLIRRHREGQQQDREMTLAANGKSKAKEK